MLLNPVVANLHNTQTDRFHPILFCESPLPGLLPAEKPVRHRSKSHHTQGFATRDEALAECDRMVEQLAGESGGPVRLCLQKDFAWDGADVPAMVVFFVERDGNLEPM